MDTKIKCDNQILNHFDNKYCNMLMDTHDINNIYKINNKKNKRKKKKKEKKKEKERKKKKITNWDIIHNNIINYIINNNLSDHNKKNNIKNNNIINNVIHNNYTIKQTHNHLINNHLINNHLINNHLINNHLINNHLIKNHLIKNQFYYNNHNSNDLSIETLSNNIHANISTLLKYYKNKNKGNNYDQFFTLLRKNYLNSINKNLYKYMINKYKNTYPIYDYHKDILNNSSCTSIGNTHEKYYMHKINHKEKKNKKKNVIYPTYDIKHIHNTNCIPHTKNNALFIHNTSNKQTAPYEKKKYVHATDVKQYHPLQNVRQQKKYIMNDEISKKLNSERINDDKNVEVYDLTDDKTNDMICDMKMI
ncbi:hypothetical protein PFTANZ_02034 [Plasmodium falciparum Tanzania (2000708)]|uniref:Uncharacterized protein n=1 Tax=Plasmodium falciparum Tanzania (2000708) TaxID=1036725 RepID=A0A024W9L8_PLAFA|nr:hypothetical protein PFTANZ_02034 [Plasmodium falciparum Tanzania (2000708)]